MKIKIRKLSEKFLRWNRKGEKWIRTNKRKEICGYSMREKENGYV